MRGPMPDEIDRLIEEMRAWTDEGLVLSSRSVPQPYRDFDRRQRSSNWRTASAACCFSLAVPVVG